MSPMLSVTYKPFMQSVVMLNVVMLSVIMLNVVMLNVLARFFGSVSMAWMLQLEQSPVRGSTLVGPQNVILGWKRMTVANNLAYYDTVKNYNRKMFYRTAPGC